MRVRIKMADPKEWEIERHLLTTSRKPENAGLNHNTVNKEILNIVERLEEDPVPFSEPEENESVSENEEITYDIFSVATKNNSDSLNYEKTPSETKSLNTVECAVPQLVSKPSGEDINQCDDSVDHMSCMSEFQNSDSCSNKLEDPEVSVDIKDNIIRNQVNFASTPHQVTGAWKDFEEFHDNFLKGCKWSPDGSCILTCSDDNMFRLFNLPTELYSDFIHCADILPEMSSVLDMREGETIYDYSWYPKMSSYEPDTCCFVSSSRDHPLHLWDAFTGQIRCSYRAYSHMDEIISPHCVVFNLDGSKIYCGFNKMVRVFDTSRPGRQCQQRPTVSKKQGQFGIISCIAISPENNGLYACGSFAKSVGIYGEPKASLLSLVEGHQGGVTHLVFSPDGHRLYSGGRKDNEIICWDMRFPGAVLYKLLRSVKTNQRMYFDIDSSGKYVVSGNHEGTVSVWDTSVSSEATSDVNLSSHMTFIGHDDCVNGISFHPYLPLLTTASGQRKFVIPDECENDKNEDDIKKSDNSLRLWKLNCNTEAVD